ncbi:hypothetical protein B0A52_02078 [Exophiala mesophila]|uniref:RRM domain-containing protein n=1 Tax=Exophiala mesophila TaxID=212818 RepID=A0A438NET5_EXOME|nr:hypothetical protein B0A52_02078 [Exophiala mesophila]
MSDKPASQAVANGYSSYPQGRLPYTAPSYQGYGPGLGLSGTSQFTNMQALKASLPAPTHVENEINASSRQGYNGPLMVLPSGQTVSLNSFYGQGQSGGGDTSNSAHLPYVHTGLFPGFVGNSNISGAAIHGYGWPYGLASNIPGFDPARRGSWSSNEDPSTNNHGSTVATQADCYPGHSYIASAIPNQHYIAGPIQPMKLPDNKAYELVNLDELVSRDPPIPRAVPALWTNQEELSLAKCLQNPEGITNVYIRGFMPDTTDEDLDRWASRFGEIESCKAIIEQDTGKCKGFGFVMYYSPASAENCIRGFFHLGFQASYAQKSRNSRLKDLEDRNSTNIYCTGVPIDWNESDLAKHFIPYLAVSTKICRDAPSGVSKEVGFARFETRDIAERVVKEFHSTLMEHDGVKLFLRFADTKAQKQLKQQSQERRNWRSREYSYSVEHTPSPTLTRLQNVNNHISPGSYQSPAGASNAFTPATSVSPADMPGMNKVRGSAWPMQGGLQSITNTSALRGSVAPYIEIPSKVATTIPILADNSDSKKVQTPSPKKVTIRIEPASGKENYSGTPQSSK